MTKKTFHFVVGDIHGCYEQLLALEVKMQRIAAREGRDCFVVSCGDLVDRGQDSAKVVRHFRLGTEAGTHACVMGNHEMMMLETIEAYQPELLLDAGCELPSFAMPASKAHENKIRSAKYLDFDDYCAFRRYMWITQGGYETLESFGTNPRKVGSWKVDRDDLRFLCSLPLIWENPMACVTHALVDAIELRLLKKAQMHPELAYQDDAVYSALWRRELPEESPLPNKIHVSGHTPYKKTMRHKEIRCIQVDTGCVMGRRLTAYCIETDEFVSVPGIAK